MIVLIAVLFLGNVFALTSNGDPPDSDGGPPARDGVPPASDGAAQPVTTLLRLLARRDASGQ